jgi:hypothetical protein
VEDLVEDLIADATVTGTCPARNVSSAARFIASTFLASFTGSSPVPER